MRGLRLGVAAAILLTGSCATQEPAAETIDTPEATESTSEGRRFSDAAVQNTYTVAREICADRGAERAARELGVSDAGDWDAIAREYSKGSVERLGHRDAAYVGCAEGLREYAEQHR